MTKILKMTFHPNWIRAIIKDATDEEIVFFFEEYRRGQFEVRL